MAWKVWKCSAIQPENDQVPLKMGTELIQVVESETNLGVTVTREGITDKLLRERIQKAYVRLETLKRIGLIAKGFRPRMSRSMYLTFIHPMFEYCWSLVRIERETMQEAYVSKEHSSLLKLGYTSSPWLRKLFKLEDFKARRIHLGH